MSECTTEERTGVSPRGALWLTLLAGTLGFLLAGLLFRPLLRGNLYLGSDLGAYHLPVRAFYSRCLKEGWSCLWWPDAFCGYYIHGEGQAGMFHPLHWILYRFLPLDWAFNVEFVSGYAIVHGGMVALLRRWAAPWHAALFAANLFAFSSFTLIHFMHMQAITIIGHLPWMLLAADVLLHSQSPRSKRRAWTTLALLSASQLLLGYPQYVLFTLLGLGVYLLLHVRASGFWCRAMLVASALVTGLLIAGVQVAPTFDVLQSALRQGHGASWRNGSLHPLNLLQWAGPYWFDNQMGYGIPPHEYGLYPGMVPLLLGLWVVFTSRDAIPWQRQIRYLALLALLALVLALGEYGGLYGLLAKLPIIGAFRCSARHIVLIHFALATLSALAVSRMHTRDMARPMGGRFLALTVACAWSMIPVVLLVRSCGPVALRDSLTPNFVHLFVGPVLLSLVAAVLQKAHRHPARALALLMTVSAFDIGAYGLPKVWNHAPQSSSMTSLLAVLKTELPTGLDEEQLRDFRAHGNWRVARLSQSGLSNYMGYVGLPPAWRLDPDAASTKRLAGVRWEKVPLHAKDWTLHTDALPRARMVTHAMVGDPNSILKGAIDLSREAVSEHALTLGEGVPGEVRWTLDTPGNVSFETRANTAQLLIFAERWHPGWHVRVDGTTASLERVNGDFMGCVVSAGVHQVVFGFFPRSMEIGMVLSVAGFAALGIGWLSLRPNSVLAR